LSPNGFAVARPLLAESCVTNPLRHAFARGLTVAVVLAASACKTSAEKLADHLETSSSWLAAIDMAGRGWLQNRVPVRFARQLVDEGRTELAASAHAIADLRVSEVDIPGADAELARALVSVDAVLTALERRDSTGVAKALPNIAAHHATIDSLASRAKSAPE
jgi:hypothetical protein